MFMYATLLNHFQLEDVLFLWIQDILFKSIYKIFKFKKKRMFLSDTGYSKA